MDGEAVDWGMEDDDFDPWGVPEEEEAPVETVNSLTAVKHVEEKKEEPVVEKVELKEEVKPDVIMDVDKSAKKGESFFPKFPYSLSTTQVSLAGQKQSMTNCPPYP